MWFEGWLKKYWVAWIGGNDEALVYEPIAPDCEYFDPLSFGRPMYGVQGTNRDFSTRHRICATTRSPVRRPSRSHDQTPAFRMLMRAGTLKSKADKLPVVGSLFRPSLLP